MGQCKLCGQSGLFLSVNKMGLCTTCNSAFLLEVQSRYRVYEESGQIINNSKNIDTIGSRARIIFEHLRRFYEFEKKGIDFMEPKASIMLQNLPREIDERFREVLQENIKDLLFKAKINPSPKSKITILSKGLLQIESAKKYLSNNNSLNDIQKELNAIIHKIQLDVFLESAQKAEFKGAKKKALEYYYEALYFLRHDEVADALQHESIQSIEEKIRELDASINGKTAKQTIDVEDNSKK